MTVEEIFSTLRAHMIQGLMLHDQIATAYSFLNLSGYQKCHEYHYFEESQNYRCLQNFYLDNYHKLIPNTKIDDPSVIPSSWYKYMRENVDTNTKRNYVKELTKMWVEWEKGTKKLFENSCKELEQQGEIFSAEKIKYFLKDVSEELKGAQEKYLNLETINYDIVSIIEEQEYLCNKYSKKISHLYGENK